MNTIDNKPVRVRYAPSPTGLPHVGNVRTALFNWLFARRFNGAFVVRIEDTDQNRLVREAVDGILEGLRWLNLDWDEGPEVGGTYGPYMQSERLEIYHEAAQDLIRRGCAYYCICSPERLKELRKQQAKEKKNPGYDGKCQNLSAQELQAYRDAGNVPVVRFKMVRDETISVDDIVRGNVEWNSNLTDDFVIIKSDGFPTYHLANVLDDHLMEITHVLRAEEWLSSTPRHIALYGALGLEPPQFGHLPMILGPDRSKLSKRHGSTSLLEYRGMGYLPESMINFMALLGWSLDDRTEILDLGALVESFSLERVVKSGAIFNIDKLEWMNGIYIRSLIPDDLAARILDCWQLAPPAEIPQPVDMEYLRRIAPLIQPRLKTLVDAAERTEFFFKVGLDHVPKDLIQKGMDVESTRRALEASLSLINEMDAFSTDALEAAFEELRLRLELSRRQFFSLLRVATTASRVSPPLFETMEVLGRGRCKDRIGGAIGALRD